MFTPSASASSAAPTRTGDWSDVTAVDAYGRRIPWTDVSHISDDMMRKLMQDLVIRLYTVHLLTDDPKLQAILPPCNCELTGLSFAR